MGGDLSTCEGLKSKSDTLKLWGETEILVKFLKSKQNTLIT